MEKINTDYKRRTRKSYSKLFKACIKLKVQDPIVRVKNKITPVRLASSCSVINTWD